MKQLKTIFAVLALLAAFSCTKSNQEPCCGQIQFEISSNEIVADQTKSNVSDYTTLPSTGDFTLEILDASSVSVWTGKVSEWDATTALPAGNYTVTASYGSLEDEGFDKPYFYGTATFAVTGGQTAAVSINVQLRNTIVLVSCTQNFQNYYHDYTFTFSRSTSTLATFVKGETKGAFIDGYKVTLSGVLSSETSQKTFTMDYSNLDEATAYTFLFDASNVGGGTITISFNDTVETIELGDLELND